MAGAFTYDGKAAIIADNKGLVRIFDTLPWVESEKFTSCGPGLDPNHCVERMKRELRLPASAAASPILW